MIDFRQLRYFVAVVEAGSFSRAADRIGIAQSALSIAVRGLEDSLGVALLVRNTKGVAATVAGEKLLDRARTILNLVSETEFDIRSIAGAPSGPVSIGIPSGVGRLLNGALFDACARELPGVPLRVVEVLPGLVLDWLAEGRIQLGVFYDIDNGTEGALLAEEHFHLVSGSSEPSLAGCVPFAQVPRFPLVLPACSHNPEQCVARRASAMGVEFDIEMHVDSLATILERVVAHKGRTILTPVAFLAEWRAGAVFAYPIEPVMKRTVRLGVSPVSSMDPAVRAVEREVIRTTQALVAANAWPRRLNSVQGDASLSTPRH